MIYNLKGSGLNIIIANIIFNYCNLQDLLYLLFNEYKGLK
jgi:hypothetical protein